MNRIFAAVALAGAVALGACSDSTDPAPLKPIAAVAVDGGFTELVSALTYVDSALNTDLVATFSTGTGPFTVFAPTNEAFTQLYGLLSTVLGAEIDEIRDVPASVVLTVLQYHVVAGDFRAANVVPASGQTDVTTLLGETFAVRANGTIADGLTGVRATDAAITTADVFASNGTVHVINQVIVPPSVVAVLTASTVSAAAQSRGTPAPGSASIAQIAIDAGFTQLVAALQYVDQELDAGLVNLFLNGTDQYTVFAPTDAAFQNLYGLLSQVLGATVDEITDVPAPVVLAVLQYHVAEGRRAANSVVPVRGERTITPLLGETFRVRTNGTIRDGLTGVRPADAAIIAANTSARNGIIHVIDQVIVPPSVVAALTN
jgi:uncharacterized surface protein with fasciclin (FAS1) repeats